MKEKISISKISIFGWIRKLLLKVKIFFRDFRDQAWVESQIMFTLIDFHSRWVKVNWALISLW